MRIKSTRNEKVKKDSELHIRVPGSLKRIIGKKAEIDGKKTSEHVYTVISKHYRLASREPRTGYECEGCDKKINTGELYYCELANMEKFVKAENNELEIENVESVPIKILCMACAQEQKKITQFSDPVKGENFVKATDRKNVP